MKKPPKKDKPKKSPPASPAPVASEPVKPEFEKAIETIATATTQAADSTEGPEGKTDGRGGARPGAGRPRGSTDEFAAVNRLPEKPNLTLVPIIRLPFDWWAESQQVPELALGKEEALDLALPVTQLLEYYFPGKIPEIAFVWLLMVGSIRNVLDPRLKIIKAKRQAKKSPAASQGVSASPSGSPPQTGFPKIYRSGEGPASN